MKPALPTRCGGVLPTLPAHAGQTLDALQSRGQRVCGVSTGLSGSSMADSSGRWSRLEVDTRRAVADRAVFMDPGQIVEHNTLPEFFQHPRSERRRRVPGPHPAPLTETPCARPFPSRWPA